MIEKCRNLVLALFPSGRAWNKGKGGVLFALASAIAEEVCRANDRVAGIIDEVDPRTTNELLENWERILGLPDECTELAESIEERRQIVVAKLILRGTQNKQFYVDLANALGYMISVSDIVEFDVFRVNQNDVGDPINGLEWVHAWSITAPENVERVFRASQNRVGERLLEFGDDILECVIEKNKPAHTSVLFQYV